MIWLNFYFDLSYKHTFVLHQFVIFAPNWNPSCSDLKSLPRFEISLPRFVISLPRFEVSKAVPICNPSWPDLQFLKRIPICNSLTAPFCNPENLFTFSFLPTLVLEFEHEKVMALWSEFDETWLETLLIWYRKINLVLINLTLATDDIIIW